MPNDRMQKFVNKKMTRQMLVENVGKIKIIRAENRISKDGTRSFASVRIEKASSREATLLF